MGTLCSGMDFTGTPASGLTMMRFRIRIIPTIYGGVGGREAWWGRGRTSNGQLRHPASGATALPGFWLGNGGIAKHATVARSHRTTHPHQHTVATPHTSLSTLHQPSPPQLLTHHTAAKTMYTSNKFQFVSQLRAKSPVKISPLNFLWSMPKTVKL